MRGKSKLARDSNGAVAPTVALSLFGLIAVGGVAFDYARMGTMDTELQNAADQAALAAAGQLDGQANACSRAVAAAKDMVANQTRMANDSPGNLAITVLSTEPGTCDAAGSVRFYKTLDKGTIATTDADAKFVEVRVDSRTAFYALTPIVHILSSGAMTGIAYAGMDTAICRVPPLMLCNPNETADPDFTVANYIGKGIRLIANDGGGTYGSGNFGFLDVGAGNGASTLRQELGALAQPGNCVSGSQVETETGSIISVRDALNTRFGIYDGGNLNTPCGTTGAGCPPSANIRQDLQLDGNGNQQSKLGIVTGVGGNGWREPANPYPGSANISSAGTTKSLSDTEISGIAPMGYPEDKCHAFKDDGIGICTPLVSGAGNRVGDGNWDRVAYFRSNSNGSTSPTNYPELQSLTTADTTAFNAFLTSKFGTTTPSRYQVYAYEMANIVSRLQAQNAPNSLVHHGNPADMAGEPTAITPGGTNRDRRVLSAAVVNCAAEGVSGHTPGVDVNKFIDIFLVQPSLARGNGTRTSNADVYVEVIGLTHNNNAPSAVQVVKKSVPYLIE